jgi:hypothetical protein
MTFTPSEMLEKYNKFLKEHPEMDKVLSAIPLTGDGNFDIPRIASVFGDEKVVDSHTGCVLLYHMHDMMHSMSETFAPGVDIDWHVRYNLAKMTCGFFALHVIIRPSFFGEGKFEGVKDLVTAMEHTSVVDLYLESKVRDYARFAEYLTLREAKDS